MARTFGDILQALDGELPEVLDERQFLALLTFICIRYGIPFSQLVIAAGQLVAYRLEGTPKNTERTRHDIN